MEDTHKTMLAKYVSAGKVFIFSKSYCPYCDDAKELFRNLDVQFGSIEVDKSNGFPEDFVKYLHQNSGLTTYPKIYIGEKCIGGFTDLGKLIDNMKLFDLFKAENIPYPE